MTIPIKTPVGIAKMREACAIAATVLDQLKPLVRPGVTTHDLEEAGRYWMARLELRAPVTATNTAVAVTPPTPASR